VDPNVSGAHLELEGDGVAVPGTGPEVAGTGLGIRCSFFCSAVAGLVPQADPVDGQFFVPRFGPVGGADLVDVDVEHQVERGPALEGVHRGGVRRLAHLLPVEVPLDAVGQPLAPVDVERRREVRPDIVICRVALVGRPIPRFTGATIVNVVVCRGPVVGPAPVLEQLEEVKLRRPGLAVRFRPERGQKASPFWGAETGLDIRPRADRDHILRVDTAGLHAVLGGSCDVELVVGNSDVVCRDGLC